MIALDAALRRLTVCQLTHESRGNGGGLRPSVWLRLRAAAGGNWTPDGTLQLEGEASFSCLGAHEALPKATLYGVVFQKLNGPLLTSGHDPRSTATSTFCATEILWDAEEGLHSGGAGSVPAGHKRFLNSRAATAKAFLIKTERVCAPLEFNARSATRRSTTPSAKASAAA